MASSAKQSKLEADPRVLQIRVLKEATLLLDQRAQDARNRAEELRLSLANRNVDSGRYESFQRESTLR